MPIIRPFRVTSVDYTKCPEVRPAKGKATREIGSCPGKVGREYVTDDEGFDDVRNYFFWKTFYLYRYVRACGCVGCLVYHREGSLITRMKSVRGLLGDSMHCLMEWYDDKVSVCYW